MHLEPETFLLGASHNCIKHQICCNWQLFCCLTWQLLLVWIGKTPHYSNYITSNVSIFLIREFDVEHVFTHLLDDLYFFQSQFSRPGFLCPHQKNNVDWTLCSNANPHLSGTSQREGNSPPHDEIPLNAQKKSCSTVTMMCFDVAVVHIEKINLKEVSMGGDGRQYSFAVS